MEKVKDNVVKSYNKDLYNMMNRDSSFNIKMKKLGYSLKPVVAVVDFVSNTYNTATESLNLDELDPTFTELFDQARDRVKRIGVTQAMEKNAVDLAKEKNQKKKKKEPIFVQNNTLKQMFDYEVLLIIRLEEELGKSISKDDLRHKVEENAIVPGYNEVAEKIHKDVFSELTLTKHK